MNDIPNLNRGRGSGAGRFCLWFFSPQTIRRVLILVAVLVTVISVVYARINWRGKRSWEEAKREMAAKGEVWDWSVYVPAPVPDDQNIFKAPKMGEWFGDDRGMFKQPLEQRVTNSFARRFFNPDSTTEIDTRAEATRYIDWSDEFQDDFDTIRTALKRPYARIVPDYSRPQAITLPNVASLYAVAKTLTQRAKCHLILGQPDKAWEELTLLHDSGRMVEGQGKFITTEGDWMNREVVRHCLQVIAKGTELHAWREPQLAAIQEQLKEIDLLALHAEALKCGGALLISSMADGDFDRIKAQTSHGDNLWVTFMTRLAPRGLMYEGAAKAATGRDSWWKMINAMTPAGGIVRPGDVTKAFASWKRAQQGLPLLLRCQTLVNEGQIACALERYRLAHGDYPPRLDTLVPQFIEKIPFDIINGEPLKFVPAHDGFLLYSFGWNEKDDGGAVVMADGLHVDAKQGDWVWKSYMY
jgi:hypothetical protein